MLFLQEVPIDSHKLAFALQEALIFVHFLACAFQGLGLGLGLVFVLESVEQELEEEHDRLLEHRWQWEQIPHQRLLHRSPCS